MKVLVIGSGGMLGSVTTQYLSDIGYEVLDISRRRKCRSQTFLINVVDKTKLIPFLQSNNFDVVINCAAILKGASEKDRPLAVLLNSYFPQWLAKYYKGSRTKIIQVSTAGVFSGTRGAYTEKDIPDTCDYYGRTKLLGEIEDSNVLNIRSDFIGPDMSSKGVGLFNWFMCTQGIVNGFSEVFFNGVTSIEFAKFINCAIQNDYSGTYHLYAAEVISKANFLAMMKEIFKKDDVEIKITDKDVIGRLKKNTSLSTIHTDIKYEKKDYKFMLYNLKNWIIKNRSFYPHYIKNLGV